MSDSYEPEDMIYRVVVNHEEQYSIWPADRELPPGWEDAGKTGLKDECLAHINEVWTDMRPLSLRRHMEEMARQQAERPSEEDDPSRAAEPQEDPLPVRLSRGSHPIEVSLRPERTTEAFREALDGGYVFLRFPETRGGTELGVRIDPDGSDLSGADFTAPAGNAKLVGTLTLDFEPVRCVADIDVATLTGHGRLELLDPA